MFLTKHKPLFSSLRRSLCLQKRGMSSSTSQKDFFYQELFDLKSNPDTTTKYRKLFDGKYVSTVDLDGKKFLKVEAEGLRKLSAQAMIDIAHLLRPAHLEQLSNILKDDEATDNDKFVALKLLKNANIASNFVLPGCQDTGTAIVTGKRGQYVLTDGEDEAHLLVVSMTHILVQIFVTSGSSQICSRRQTRRLIFLLRLSYTRRRAMNTSFYSLPKEVVLLTRPFCTNRRKLS